MQNNRSYSSTNTPSEKNSKERSEMCIVNEVTLDGIRELRSPESPEILGKLITLYLDISPGMIDEIYDAFAQGDTEKVERTAHSLKSSSAHLGADTLSESCRLIEMAAREKKLDSLANRISCLMSVYREVAFYLSKYAS